MEIWKFVNLLRSIWLFKYIRNSINLYLITVCLILIIVAIRDIMYQWFQNGPHIQNNKVLKICYICVRVQTLENKFAFNLGLISQEMLISFIFKFKIIYLFIYRMFIFLRINWLTYLCSLIFQYYIRSINKWLRYT